MSGHACCLAEIRRDVSVPGPAVAVLAGRPGPASLLEADFTPGSAPVCDSLAKGVQSSQVVGGLQESGLRGECLILITSVFEPVLEGSLTWPVPWSGNSSCDYHLPACPN